MVVDAVGFEPVSASQYPANREIYRETKRHKPTQLVFSAAEVIISTFLQRNSLDERTENFSVLSRDSGMSASPPIAAVGADIPISRNVPEAILARTRIGRQSCGLLAWKFAER
jgi:hypothetical protein